MGYSFWIAGLESDLSIHTAVSVTGYSGEEWVFLKRRDRLQVQVNIDFCQERAVIVVIFNKDLDCNVPCPSSVSISNSQI